MRELLDRLLARLAAAGIRAQEALPAKLTPQLKAPLTAVGIARASHAPAGLGRYLGMREDAQAGEQAVYGALLEAEIFFKIASPVGLGGGRCFQEAMGLMEVLLAGVDGAEITECRMEPCRYEARADRFECVVTAALRAAVYLERSGGGEAAFSDFQLRGEVQ